MGKLAFGEDRVEEALAYFKIALIADSNEGEYWLNYIDALLELNMLDDAKAVFDQARHKGAKGEAFDLIGKRLSEPNVSWTVGIVGEKNREDKQLVVLH